MNNGNIISAPIQNEEINLLNDTSDSNPNNGNVNNINQIINLNEFSNDSINIGHDQSVPPIEKYNINNNIQNVNLTDSKPEERFEEHSPYLKDKSIINNTQTMNNNLYINIDQMKDNFTSRDLVKLLIALSKKKSVKNNILNNDFSMKGIKYWENLAKDKRYAFLFKRYKPWSLHTLYKRLFSNASVEEIERLLIGNPNYDLNSITNTVWSINKKGTSKRFNCDGRKFLGNKTTRKNLKEINYDNDKDNTQNEIGDQDEMEVSSQIITNKKQINNASTAGNGLNVRKDKRLENEKFTKIQNYLNNTYNLDNKYLNLINDLKTNNKECVSNKLSDIYDNINNLIEGKIYSNYLLLI